MKKSKTQARHAARTKAAKPETVEPFSVLVARAGKALADLVDHEACPPELVDFVSEVECSLFNEYQDLALQVRLTFGVFAEMRARDESRDRLQA